MTTPSTDLAAQTSRLVLETLQQVSGPQYAKLLQQAGLERFLASGPLMQTPTPLTVTEIQQLLQTVWSQLGEDLFRLYEQNMGKGMARGFVQGPVGAQLRAGAQTLPPDQRLAWAVRTFYGQMVASRSHSTLQEHPDAWHLRFEPCLACLGITGAQAPICASVAIVTQQLLAHAVESRVKVTEIACHAQGAATCVFAITK